MVAPYPLMLLFLATGLVALQIPALPTLPLTVFAATGITLALVLALVRLRVRDVKDAEGGSSQLQWVRCAVLLSVLTLSVLVLVLYTSLKWQTRQLSPLCQRELVTVKGTVDGLVQHLSGPRDVYRFNLRVAHMEPQRCAGPERIRLYLDADSLRARDQRLARAGASRILRREPADLAPGAQLKFEARLRHPWGTVNPASRTGEKAYVVSDIHAVGSLRTLHSMSAALDGTLSMNARIHRLRSAISSSLRDRVPDSAGALLAALAVGDRRFMTPETWTRLRVFGLTHLMVISGLHISMLAIPGWYVGAALGRAAAALRAPQSFTLALAPSCAVFFAGGYALLSGLALPAQRALLMLSLLMIPRLLGRSVKAAGVLPMAAITLQLLNPSTLLTASFWLTIGAVGLLLWFSSWRSNSGWLRSLWSAQGYMLMAMLPLGLFWFQEAGSIGAVVNLLAVPLITFLVVPLLLCAVALEPLWLSLATTLLDCAAFCLSSLWSALAYWEPIISRWSVLRVSPGVTALLLALLGVLVVALPRFQGRVSVVGLLLMPLSIPASNSNDAVELLFFDVGQGTAVLLRHEGKALLYDTGGGPVAGPAVASRTVVPALQSMGIQTLEALIISHADRDHDAGEAVIIQRSPPDVIHRAVSSAGARACRLGATWRFSRGVTLRYLSRHLAGDSDNNGSCVLLISVYGRNVLLPGDIDAGREREILRYWGKDLTADVLLAGHHGSASSNSRLWLRSLAPEALIVTAGHGNRFGHPAPRVGDSAAASGIPLLNTASRGAISMSVFPDGRMKCRAFRHRWAPFWRRGDFDRDCLPP